MRLLFIVRTSVTKTFGELTTVRHPLGVLHVVVFCMYVACVISADVLGLGTRTACVLLRMLTLHGRHRFCSQWSLLKRMPVIYFSKHCHGLQQIGSCCWSTELLGNPASIRPEQLLCEICIAIGGLEGNRQHLQLHLADLYKLDTDQFRKARTAIGDCTFNAIGAGVLSILTTAVPSLKRGREDQRKVCLARTLSLLTDGSWLINCWNKRFAEDTRDICWCEAALGYLPIAIRGRIYEFACADAWKLFAYLCDVKRRGYHTLDQPIFWHPPRDFQDVDTDEHSPARKMLTGVYSYVVKHMHKPKLKSLKHTLVRHKDVTRTTGAMQRHVHMVRKAIAILDCILDREIAVVCGVPLGFGVAA